MNDTSDDVDLWVKNFKQFLEKVKLEYGNWTIERSSEVLDQLNRLKEKTNHVVVAIEQNLNTIAENFREKSDFYCTFLTLKVILKNFQDLIEVIEEISKEEIFMTRKKDFILRIIDILMRTFDCTNTHHRSVTLFICELLSIIPMPEANEVVTLHSNDPPLRENEVQLSNSTDRELLSMIDKDTVIIDSYPAVEENTNDIVLVVFYDGTLPTNKNDVSGKRIIWKEKVSMNSYAETKRWEEFQSHSPKECSEFIALFISSQKIIEIISHRSDVLAIYPSTKLQGESVVPVFRVIIKAVGYIPLYETHIPLPLWILVNGVEVDMEYEEGDVTPCSIKSGDGIAFENSLSGYGTLGGVATDKCGKYFAVTNEHVINGSWKNVLSFEDDVQKLCTPSPGWRKYKLLRDIGIATLDESGKFQDHVDALLWDNILKQPADGIRRFINSQCLGINNLRNGEITVKEIVEYSKFEQHNIGHEIIRLNEDVVIGNSRVSCDIALIEFEYFDPSSIRCTPSILSVQDIFNDHAQYKKIKVSKIGATSGPTNGIITRPAHIKHLELDNPSLKAKFSKLVDSNRNPGRVLLNQLLIHGVSFGVRGDSGTAVVRITNGGVQFVGIFVGSFDSNLYYCSPAEVLIQKGFTFHLLSPY